MSDSVILFWFEPQALVLWIKWRAECIELPLTISSHFGWKIEAALPTPGRIALRNPIGYMHRWFSLSPLVIRKSSWRRAHFVESDVPVCWQYISRDLVCGHLRVLLPASYQFQKAKERWFPLGYSCFHDSSPGADTRVTQQKKKAQWSKSMVIQVNG